MQICSKYEIVEISNIEPFNETVYKDCFYSATFPIIDHFLGSIIPFIVNNIYFYNYDNIQRITYKSKQFDEFADFQNTLSKIGIILVTKLQSEDIISDLINSIKANKPVVILIDCFYESIRHDIYQKRHVPHAITIYGYNTKEQYFNIIEANYLDSILNVKRTLSFNDVKNSYNGFITNLHYSKFFTYFEYSYTNTIQKDKQDYINNSIVQYKQNLLDNRNLIIEGLNAISIFTENFKSILEIRDLSSINLEVLLKNLDILIRNKLSDKYTFVKIFGNKNNLVSQQDSVIGNWNIVRAILNKYKFSSIFKQDSFNVLLKKLSDIYNIECAYYKKFFDFLENGDE